MTAKRFALLGDPVAHSKSPRMHAAAYAALGLPHRYEALHTPADEVPARIEALRRGEYDGFNVTVPHKTRVIPFLDELAPSALIAGAVNTVVRAADGKLVGHNTDAPAIAIELEQLAPDLAARAGDLRAVVLGSGGASRSAICALAMNLGVRTIALRARSLAPGSASDAFLDEMRALLRRAGSVTELVVEPFAANAASDADVAFVVQATSAGMHGVEGGESVAAVVDWAALPARAAAYDVVYVPPVTPFLRAAADHGLRHANGVGMLARQGALAFELWLGVRAPLDAMFTTLV
jgi:shikimate dehydrogenase